ncbi:MAG TPA: glycosyltransferase [Anaerolineae bacterium]|nr:glycosyltransferase [Anaerolineae bacterium]
MARSILVLMCDSGGGHRSVADAITGALEYLFPGRYDFHLADIIAEGYPFPLSAAGRLYGPVVDRLPRPWGLLWHSSNGRRRSLFLLQVVAPLSFDRIQEIVRTAEPDVIVSTHPCANHAVAWLRQRHQWGTPLITVVTDLVSIHRWWLCPAADLCLVPTEQARRRALDAGFETDRVKVVGMPISLKFLDAPSGKQQLRKQLGLREDDLTVLVIGGGEGMGNVFSISRAVAQAGLDIQLVVVAGRNQALKSKLESASWEVPTRVLGFVDNMPTLMHSADLLVTKAGPSTMSEALSCGLPMLISGALRGQEEGNAEWAVATGAAIFSPTPEKLVLALRGLARNGAESLARMRQRAREAARPDAALNAARLINHVANPRSEETTQQADLNLRADLSTGS